VTATTTIESEKPEAAEEVVGLDLPAQVGPAIEPVRSSGRTFWIGLALAFTLHASMFVPLVGGYLTASSRRMGEADGAPDSMSVEVVQEAAIPGATAPPPEPPPAPPSPPEPAKTEPQDQPPPTPPPKQAQQQPPPLSKAEPAPKPVPPAPPSVPVAEEARSLPDIRGTTEPDPPPSESPPAERATAQKPTETAALMKEMTELFAPDPVRRTAPPSKAAPTPPADPNAPRPVLDAPMEFQGNSSSFARPIDITRSGENDEFGRGVIRALRQTMPSPWGLKSRVTIKFLLSETGQVAEMRLVQGSGYPLVDQSVVFAASHSSFPRPPRGSKVADRIFMVTYIYE
jgi:outer membrane biosynthesis protein TonB